MTKGQPQPNLLQVIIQTVVAFIFGGILLTLLTQVISLTGKVSAIESRLDNVSKNADLIPNISVQLARIDERQQNTLKILDEVRSDLKKIVTSASTTPVVPSQDVPASQTGPRISGPPSKADPGLVGPIGKAGSGPASPGKAGTGSTNGTPVLIFILLIVATILVVVIVSVVAIARGRAKAA